MENYELDLAGLARFEKIKEVGFSWVFWVSNIIEKVYGGFINLRIISWV